MTEEISKAENFKMAHEAYFRLALKSLRAVLEARCHERFTRGGVV